MQYGNRVGVTYDDIITDCLNRTMQYGNIHPSIVEGVKNEFKSYYVVWKLISTHFLGILGHSFKSYYVVWKLLYVSTNIGPGHCLNRTMQYGNRYDENMYLRPLPRLNRTMQYGNPLREKRRTAVRLSLNRTMQYGNSLQG